MQIKFHKKKFAFTTKVNELIAPKLTHQFGYINDDVIKEFYTSHIEGFILSRLLDNRRVTMTIAPQKFWDWIFHRPQKIVFDIKFEEVLKNPPALSEGQSTVIYEISNP